MFDFRPAGYTIGLLVIALGVAMVIPMATDFALQNGQGQSFAICALITTLCGVALTLACQSKNTQLNIQQTFLLTTGVWVVLPFFGALPFIFGATDMGVTDAFFEAMSGFTTTGATVISNLETLPKGLLLWRALMQWFGGIGVIVVAMVFLPILRIGGMQIFRMEGVDTFGKILPGVAQIARSILGIYLLLSFLCFGAYSLVGLGYFDAISHAMTTIATGGFANYDTSFAALGAGAEYVAIVFMILAALPFVRYVQLANGRSGPLLGDAQVRGFLAVVVAVIAVFTLWQMRADYAFEPAFRKAAFNGISLLTGTGFVSDDYMKWGGFAIVLFFLIGLVGGCAGSTTCSIKIFRFQLLGASVLAQIQRFYMPSGVFQPYYQNRAVSEEVISSVMAFFVLFMASLAGVAILLGLTGLDMLTAVSGASAALANIGPGLGDVIGPAGNYGSLSLGAKWILAGAMLLGRLELMAVYVLFSFVFWRG